MYSGSGGTQVLVMLIVLRVFRKDSAFSKIGSWLNKFQEHCFIYGIYKMSRKCIRPGGGRMEGELEGS